ncbi:class C beta-lactamase [Shinella zoogloeoides]|uniref:class C beta-lactamase n=1 Tax=Shinella zoogloeoides TaxID=352475 RepID=UPI00273DB932|nr:class C beta-lactamase [Shinella zoogloeoides]WLR95347.1 class C beta-lactamase [Shinella zoogloeoides]
MKNSRSVTSTLIAAAYVCSAFSFLPARAVGQDIEREIAPVIDKTIRAVMSDNSVPGMAVGIIVGERQLVFNYGFADRENAAPVTDDTLFEIGSVSKTFAATLGAYAAAEGKLALSDPASRHMPALAGSAFDRVSLLDLATYTGGGLPLQFPDEVIDDTATIRYFRAWRPEFRSGTHRVYSNPSIGLFGQLAAESLGQPYVEAIQDTLLSGFGLAKTYIHVPEAEMKNYAFGYNKAGKPVRVNPGALDAQAYGVKTTARDMLRFIQANIDPSRLELSLQKAIAATKVGYYRTGDTYQSLGWELYAWPATIDVLLQGNSSDMALKPQLTTRLEPPQKPAEEVFMNKTGSTGGFGAYAAFIPGRGIGIVLLGNRNFPVPERIKAAYTILSALEK